VPIYEYECSRCHHRFDVKQAFADTPIQECPQCQGAVRRVLYPAGIVFKGSGFYVTDNRRIDSGPARLGSTSGPDEGTKKKEGESREPVAAAKSEGGKGPEPKAEEKVAG
jgi:putative FmdB family regulatory protein